MSIAEAFRKAHRGVVGYAIASILACSVCAEVQAQSNGLSRTVTVRISPQKVSTALLELSQQAGVQVLMPGEIGDQQSTQGVSGEMSLEQALQKLLEGTSLRFKSAGENVIGVESAAGNKRAGMGNTGLVRLAAAKTASTSTALPVGDVSSESAGRQASLDDSGPRGTGLEEIVVTAQKREERLQDVPISISVLGGEQLDKYTVEGVHEALGRVPGVVVDTGGGTGTVGGGTQLAIRGVTAPSSYGAGSTPVAYYLDAVPFGFAKSAVVPDVNAYDLDRVEVLRGPQGTLYGASAQAGVVRVLTHNAELDNYELKARAATSNTKEGGWNYRGDMAVNVPIVEGKFAARAVLGYQNMDGWIDRTNRRDANDSSQVNARLKLNAQPTEQLSIGLSAWISRFDSGAPDVGEDSTGGLQRLITDVESMAADLDSYGLNIGYDFSSISLVSTSSYVDYASDNNLGEVPIAGAPHTLALTTLAAKTFTQEINLRSTAEGAWRWTAGAIYRDSKDDLLQRNYFVILPYWVQNLSESWAAYGELTRIFFDGRLELTAGLRYFEDDVGQRELSRTGNVPPPALVNTDSKYDATTPRVTLTWLPRQQLTVYATYAEGFRSGYDQNPQVVQDFPGLRGVKPDLLKNYELGAKGSFLDGRVAFDVATYYMDYQDVQLPLLVTFPDGQQQTAAVNGASASGPGIDLALNANPVRGLELGITVGWNDLTVDADVFSGGIVLFNEGDRLNQSVETTLGASASYAFPLGGNGLEGRFSASANQASERMDRVLSGTAVRVNKGETMLTSRAGFSIDSPAGWSATLFADNLNNERDRVTQAFIVGGGPSSIYLRPRTIGVQFDYRFE